MRTHFKDSRNGSRMSTGSGRLGRVMRAALRHPFGITLLIASLLLAIAVRLIPVLERWSAQAPWVLLLGITAYVASVVALQRSVPESRLDLSMPEMRELNSIRSVMQSELANRKGAEVGGSSELSRMLSEAIIHLDVEVAPALRQVVQRQTDLISHLARYDSGELPLPEPIVIERLQAIRARQRAAIDECVQQASNAAGTLMALLQEGDDASVAARSRTWANDLSAIYETIAEVLRGDGGQGALAGLVEQTAVEYAAPVGDAGASSDAFRSNGHPSDDFRRHVEEALRQLNNPFALSGCELVGRLPGTLAATRSLWGDGVPADPTPLEQAKAVREVLVSAIDRLKPPSGDIRSSAPEAFQHNSPVREVRAAKTDQARHHPPQHQREHVPPQPSRGGLRRRPPARGPGGAGHPGTRAALGSRLTLSPLLHAHARCAGLRLSQTALNWGAPASAVY